VEGIEGEARRAFAFRRFSHGHAAPADSRGRGELARRRSCSSPAPEPLIAAAQRGGAAWRILAFNGARA
jgi:hypothetical protein